MFNAKIRILYYYFVTMNGISQKCTNSKSNTGSSSIVEYQLEPIVFSTVRTVNPCIVTNSH